MKKFETIPQSRIAVMSKDMCRMGSVETRKKSPELQKKDPGTVGLGT